MLKKYFQASFVILTLMVSFSVQAGFREALSALQHKDAEKMLIEVEKAVKSKKYDGVYLFVPTLSSWYFRGEFVPETMKQIAIDKTPSYSGFRPSAMVDLTWGNFLNQTQQARLAKSLEQLNNLNKPYQEMTNELLMLVGGVVRPQETKLPEQAKNQPTVISWDYLAKTTSEENAYKKIEERAYDDYGQLTLNGYGENNYGDICRIGDAYRDGLYGRQKDERQAYLWYLRGWIRGAKSDFCLVRIESAYKNDWIKKYDHINYQRITYYYANGNPGVPVFNNFIETEHPQSVVDYQSKQDLPIIQLTETLPGYKLRIYQDGRVQYTTNLTDNKTYIYKTNKVAFVNKEPFLLSKINGLEEWKVKKSLVNKLLTDLNKLTANLPNDISDAPPCGNGPRASIIERTLIFGKPVEQKRFVRNDYWGSKGRHVQYVEDTAAMLTLIEKYIPTQHLRCGEEDISREYLACIAADKKLEEASDTWIKRQQAKK